MADANSGKGRGIWLAAVFVLLLTLVYAIAQEGLAEDVARPETLAAIYGFGSAAASFTPASTSADVPDSVVQAVAESLKDAGNIDELAVLPDPAGGYQVSATITLGYGQVPPVTELQSEVDTSAEAFFADVFGAGPDIRHAEVYWMDGGEIVAGAGLGAAAFDRVTAAAATGGSWIEAVTAQTHDTEDVNEAWLEFRNPGGQAG